MAHSTPVALSVSDSEESKREKRREYNREAQRAFSVLPLVSPRRRKRKEHIGNLETALIRHDIEQSTELQVLRHKNKQLIQENESLRLAQRQRYSGSIGVDSRAAPFASLVYAPLDAYCTTTAPTTLPPAGAFEAFSPPEASDRLVIMPINIAKVRSTLHQLFAPMLNSDPGCQLQALHLLSPSLPPSLKPTRLQLTVLHDPHIDMLPSSVLRDRLIAIGPVLSKTFITQVCTSAVDIEDNGQITIWGEDWDDVRCWEFSAPVLECWGGWLLTEEWVQRANFWRIQRGAGVLEDGNDEYRREASARKDMKYQSLPQCHNPERDTEVSREHVGARSLSVPCPIP